MILPKRTVDGVRSYERQVAEAETRIAALRVTDALLVLRNFISSQARFGISVDASTVLDSEFPLYPLTLPGMPEVGPDFRRVADQLAAIDSTLIDPVLRAGYQQGLLGAALYEPRFTMPILCKRQPVPAKFIPGHLWEAPEATGPRTPADVMIIGKMPAAMELAANVNFAGDSGFYLRKALQETGMKDLGSIYVTNLVKFPIPVPSLGNTLEKSWIKTCALLLHQELCFIRPKFVLCLGSEASQYFLGTTGKVSISANRVFDQKIAVSEGVDHNFKLMTALHPAAVARAPDLYNQFASSIRLFVQLTKGESLGSTEESFNIDVIRNATDAWAFARWLRETSPTGLQDLAIDAEWHMEYPTAPGAYIRTIQVADSANHAVVFMLNDEEGKPVFQPEPKALAPVLADIFRSTPERPVCTITHFGRADLPWIRSLGFDMLPMMQVPADTPDSAGFMLMAEQNCPHGWDTGLAAHTLNETDEFKLEIQASRYADMIRWDGDLQVWKKEYCKANKLDAEELEGYGPCPDEVLVPYGGKDAIGTWRLKQYQCESLSSDIYGQDSWLPFWRSSIATPAVAEIEESGIVFDTAMCDQMTKQYMMRKAALIQEIQDMVEWPTFKPSSVIQVKELLYGVGYSGKRNKITNQVERVSPIDAKLCNLTPIKSSSKATKKSWADLVARGEANKHSPSTDKETLGILGLDNPVALKLRHIRFLTQLVNNTLRPADINKKTKATILDEDGNPMFSKGLRAWVWPDGRIHTHIRQTVETGRWASSRPNLMALSKRREADYQLILGDSYPGPMRMIFKGADTAQSYFNEPCALMEGDFSGAELAVMAWNSQDPAMLEHVRRNLLPENHPDYYDIHSNIAVSFFNLRVPNEKAVAEILAKCKLKVNIGDQCPPTKKGLEACGYLHLRVAAKNVIFGYAYGRGAAAIARQCKEEAKPGQPEVTVEEAQILIDGLGKLYPDLVFYLSGCKDRVASPGWLRNCFGRLRRFTPSNDRQVMGELQRQAMNFPIQSAVADAMNMAIFNLYNYRNTHDVLYRIVMQIHDAVILEVPIRFVEEVYDNVMPRCMTDMVDVWPADLDGFPLAGVREPYHLGTDRTVHLRWGAYPTPAEATAVGLPLRFAKEPKGKK